MYINTPKFLEEKKKMLGFIFRLLIFASILRLVYGQFMVKPQNQTVLEGGTVQFNCSLYPINFSDVNQVRQWRASDLLVIGNHEPGLLPGYDRRYYYVSDNQEELNLRITNVQPEDDGEYECQMMRKDIRMARASVFLNVIG